MTYKSFIGLTVAFAVNPFLGLPYAFLKNEKILKKFSSNHLTT